MRVEGNPDFMLNGQSFPSLDSYGTLVVDEVGSLDTIFFRNPSMVMCSHPNGEPACVPSWDCGIN